MNKKNDIEVLIGGIKYTLSGYESSEYMVKIAAYINGKLDEIQQNIAPGGWLDNESRNILLQINIADDYYKEIDRNSALIEEKNQADKAYFNLKHELFDVNEMVEKLSAQNKALKDELAAEKKKSEERLSEDYKRHEDELKEANRKLKEELDEANRRLEEEIEAGKKKIEEAEQKIEEEKKKVEKTSEELEQAVKKNRELEETIDDLLR